MGRLYLISVHRNLSKNSALRNHFLFCLAGHLYTATLADTTTTVNLGTLSKDHTGTTMPTGTKMIPYSRTSALSCGTYLSCSPHIKEYHPQGGKLTRKELAFWNRLYLTHHKWPKQSDKKLNYLPDVSTWLKLVLLSWRLCSYLFPAINKGVHFNSLVFRWHPHDKN